MPKNNPSAYKTKGKPSSGLKNKRPPRMMHKGKHSRKGRK